MQLWKLVWALHLPFSVQNFNKDITYVHEGERERRREFVYYLERKKKKSNSSVTSRYAAPFTCCSSFQELAFAQALRKLHLPSGHIYLHAAWSSKGCSVSVCSRVVFYWAVGPGPALAWSSSQTSCVCGTSSPSFSAVGACRAVPHTFSHSFLTAATECFLPFPKYYIIEMPQL